MAKCSCCNKFILGGKKRGDFRFCNEACLKKGFLVPLAEQVAPDLVEERIGQLHQQSCPCCGGDGPIDISTSHTAWSFIIVTSWKDRRRMSCRSCGRKAILRGMMFTAVLGWWGFPLGPLVTPLQLFHGVKSLNRLPHAALPSEELQQIAKLDVAGLLERQENLI